MSNPKLTVLIPAYNAGATIERTLASLDAQIDQNFNVIVFNDGSKDVTSNAIKWCVKSLTRYRYAAGDHLGVGATRERLAKLCETEYFTFLDADDVLLPFATKFMNLAIKEKTYDDIIMFNFYEEHEDNLKLITQADGLTWCHGKVYKKSFIESNGISFDPGLRTGEDSYVNAICFELGKFSVIDIPVAVWCNNPKSVTRTLTPETLHDFVLDNALGLLKAIEFLKGRKPINEIKSIEANIPVIESNIRRIKYLGINVDDITKVYEEIKSYRGGNNGN